MADNVGAEINIGGNGGNGGNGGSRPSFGGRRYGTLISIIEVLRKYLGLLFTMRNLWRITFEILLELGLSVPPLKVIVTILLLEGPLADLRVSSVLSVWSVLEQLVLASYVSYKAEVQQAQCSRSVSMPPLLGLLFPLSPLGLDSDYGGNGATATALARVLRKIKRSAEEARSPV
ncbi:hypothetical protein Sjap_009334 [Stephania japonica]|uniref:Uncharacterized protein n=1 Tax=Stephania japonica TaxID=461633 RepID=A0AAP0JS55_9MAGN